MDPELEQLQGTWQAVRAVTVGGPIPGEVVCRLQYVFAGDRVTLLEDGQATGKGAVTVRLSTPNEIDVAMSTGPGKGQVAVGVYEIIEGRLRLCIGPERPAGFSPIGLASLVELERAPNAST